MKKRIFCLLLALCLGLSCLPVSASAAELMTRVSSIPDTAMESDHTIYDASGNPSTFSYTGPQGGATMLVFFSTECPNSQTLFKRLNTCSWIKNPYVNIIAIETARRNTESLNPEQVPPNVPCVTSAAYCPYYRGKVPPPQERPEKKRPVSRSSRVFC